MFLWMRRDMFRRMRFLCARLLGSEVGAAARCRMREIRCCRCGLPHRDRVSRCLEHRQSVKIIIIRDRYSQLRISSRVRRKSGSVRSWNDSGRLQLSSILMHARTLKAETTNQKFLSIALLTIIEVTSSLAKSMTSERASIAAKAFPATKPQAIIVTKN